MKWFNLINEYTGNKGEAIAVQGDAPFTLSCTARFDPSATFSQITWFYNGVPLALNGMSLT